MALPAVAMVSLPLFAILDGLMPVLLTALSLPQTAIKFGDWARRRLQAACADNRAGLKADYIWPEELLALLHPFRLSS